MEKRHYTLNDLDGHDIYTIIEINGVKAIHILCYYWERDSEYEDEEGNILSWARTDATGIIIPLEEFIAEVKKDETRYIDILWEETKQYQYDLTREKAEVETEGDYIYLPYNKITIDTPYGEYFA